MARRERRSPARASSACARPTRCSMPFENPRSARCRGAASRPTSSSTSGTRSRSRCAACRTSRPWSCESSAGRQPVVETEIFRKESDAAPGLDVADRRAEHVRGAARRFTRPSSILMDVLFPAPFGPRNPKISPRGTSSERSRTAIGLRRLCAGLAFRSRGRSTAVAPLSSAIWRAGARRPTAVARQCDRRLPSFVQTSAYVGPRRPPC